MRDAGKQAAEELADAVLPYAHAIIDDHRAAGRPLVLATTTPDDMIRPLAERLGFDDVVATRYGVDGDGRYDGTIDGEFVWGRGKLAAVRAWAEAGGVRPRPQLGLQRLASTTTRCSARSATRWWSTPTPGCWRWRSCVAGRWSTSTCPPACPSCRCSTSSLSGSLQSLVRPEFLPWLRFDVDGVEQHPQGGAGHRRVQPPQLPRSAGAGHDVRPPGPGGAVPGQEGGVRRPDRGPAGPGHGRHPGRPGHGLGRPAGRGRRRTRGRRAGRDPARGHDPPGPGVLRPGAQGPLGRRPPGCPDQGPGRADRAVGHRAGLAPLRAGAASVEPDQPAHGSRPRRRAGRPQVALGRGRHQADHGRDRRPAAAGGARAAGSRRPRSWPGPTRRAGFRRRRRRRRSRPGAPAGTDPARPRLRPGSGPSGPGR